MKSSNIFIEISAADDGIASVSDHTWFVTVCRLLDLEASETFSVAAAFRE